MKNAKNESGFSLVEALVSGAIMTVVSVILITILNLTNLQANQGTVKTKLQMDYDNILMQIGDDIRSSAYIFGPGETRGTVLGTVDLNVTEIHCWTLDRQIGAYQISGNKLQEYDFSLSQWKDYKSGSNPVYLSGISRFFLKKGRKSATLNFIIKQSSRVFCDSLSTLGGTFICRN